jgi:hypothetical protein
MVIGFNIEGSDDFLAAAFGCTELTMRTPPPTLANGRNQSAGNHRPLEGGSTAGGPFADRPTGKETQWIHFLVATLT